MTRAEKNNNPLNIRHSKDTFAGEITGDDKSFKTFRTMAMGYRAAFVILGTYKKKYGLTCIAEIVNRWAPEADDNDTEAYIKFVSNYTDIPKYEELTAEKYVKVVEAMAKIEGVKEPNVKEIIAGYKQQNSII